MLLKRWRGVDLLRDEIGRIEEEMSRWLGGSNSAAFPSMNIWRNDEQICVEVELPGVGQEDVAVRVTPENHLVVSGERKRPADEEERFYRRERRFGEFRRQVKLPVEVDPEQVTAQLKAGILQIHLKEKEALKPRKIEVLQGSAS